MNKKILFISHEASLSGAPIVLLNLIRWIREYRTDVECVLLLKNTGPLLQQFRDCCKVELLIQENRFVQQLPQRIQSYLSGKQFKKKIGQLCNSGYDLVYSNTIANGNILEQLKGQLSIPVLVHVHEMKLTIREFGKKNLLQNLHAADYMIANSAIVQQQLLELFEEQQVCIPTGVVWPFVEEKEMVESADKNKGSEYVIGGAGSFEWRKGIELFIYTAAAVCVSRNDVRFVWVGGNHDSISFARYQYLIEILGINDRVKFVAATDEPGKWFSSFDVFFLSSVEEPFSLVCLENALLQKPVVCFKGCSGMEELLIPAAGVAVPLGDISAAADKIIELLADEKKRMQMGETGRALVLNNAVVNVNAPKIMEIVDKIISKQIA